MLFRKKIERRCSYCGHSTALSNGQFLCAKRGVRNEDDCCLRFRYDPCKRIPPRSKAIDFTQYEKDDFSL